MIMIMMFWIKLQLFQTNKYFWIKSFPRSDNDHSARLGPSDVVQPPPQNGGWPEQGQVRQSFSFNVVPGLKIDILNPEDDLEFFQLYFDENLVNMIVHQTNLYAVQYMEDHGADLKQRLQATKLIDTDCKEMLSYFALLLLQGVVHTPIATNYFSKNSNQLKHLFFAKR